MRITKHISFFYIESRICYINNIINETNKYECTTDIYIHTNDEKLTDSVFTTYNNGLLKIIHHDLSKENPFYLTWKCRDLLEKQKDDYDIFIYIEDDILVPYKAIQYWLDYNEKLIERGYNLGFVRIEVNKDKVEFINDFKLKLDTITKLDDNDYAVNTKYPYCAFWIYNKNEFNRFVSSKFYDIRNISGYLIRESSAIGLHGLNTRWYKNTLIPIVDNKLIDSCKIYHMPNNYVDNKKTCFAKIKFIDAIGKYKVVNP
jgi:hypothetical protein